MRKPFRPQDEGANLRKQKRRQLLAAFDRRGIGEAPGLEELDELLARAVIVPFTVALDDLEELLRRLLALALGVERDGKIEARLMIERIGEHLLFQLRERPERLRLL